jgi:hypothetical protein
MPGPSTRKKLLPLGLPVTAWGVTPSDRKPAGGAGVEASHFRKGSMGPPAPRLTQPVAGQGPVAAAKLGLLKAPVSVVSLMSRPARPSAVTLKVFWPYG